MTSRYLTVAAALAILTIICGAGPGIEALELSVTNTAAGTPGGRRFDLEIGRSAAMEIMRSGNEFIWNVFRQPHPAQRKNVRKISLLVETVKGIAFSINDEIHLSSDYVGSYSGDLKREIRGVLYHELTHVWQWNGNGNAPSGLVEGIADYVKLVAGLASAHWVKPGGGNKWDEGYDVTAYFLQYCESLRPGFVALMNAKLVRGWSVRYFDDILGKSVDVAWRDYKAKYASS